LLTLSTEKVSACSPVALRRAVRQGGHSPTERHQRSRLVEGQDEQVDGAEPLTNTLKKDISACSPVG